MRILVTGGAGYVGSNLVPKLLSTGYEVTVLDLYIYGDDTLAGYRQPRLTEIKGDLRNGDDVVRALKDCGAVIHLACISNDPCHELNPKLFDAMDRGSLRPLIRAAKDNGVRRFIYASSSSVYGIKDEDDVTEDLKLEPLTAYSECKVRCEQTVAAEREPGFVTTILRPATICGYSPRLRLDVVVNALLACAVTQGRIQVDGGAQMRASLNIEDMSDLYVRLLEMPDEAIDGKTWNIGCANHAVAELALLVQKATGATIMVNPIVDKRSYRISSQRIKDDIGFVPKRTVSDAVASLRAAFDSGEVTNAMTDDRYYNVKRMQNLRLA